VSSLNAFIAYFTFCHGVSSYLQNQIFAEVILTEESAIDKDKKFAWPILVSDFGFCHYRLEPEHLILNQKMRNMFLFSGVRDIMFDKKYKKYGRVFLCYVTRLFFTI